MNRLLVLILGCLFIITLGFGPAGLALCMPTLAADLHLTYTQQGVLLSIGLWAFLVALLKTARPQLKQPHASSRRRWASTVSTT